MSDLAKRLDVVRAALRDAAIASARPADAVQLLAVSKTQPASALREAWGAGQRAFGENYLQEALAKQEALADLPIEWHFIGAIQSNKTAAIARAFDWVHTIDRLRIAERLQARRGDDLPPLNVLIEVNVSGEPSKHGVTPAALPALIPAVAALPRLRLRGLMTLPAPSADVAAQRAAFRVLATLARSSVVPLDTLSMGTSDDYRAAIAEGSTLVRLGTAVFGPRRGAA
jgi:PLP dependent protein